MKKLAMSVIVAILFWAPVTNRAGEAMRGEAMLPALPDVTSQLPSTDYAPPTYSISSQTQPLQTLKEWYVVAKIPTVKSLKIGVFLFQEGMTKEHICYKFGEPQDTIILDADGLNRGCILVYPKHYFFLSSTGNLLTVRERP